MRGFAPQYAPTKTELNKIQKHQHWYSKVFPGYLLGLYHQGVECAVYFTNKRFSETHYVGVCFLYKDVAWWFWDYKELKRVRRNVLKKIEKDPAYFVRIFRTWNKTWDKFLRVIAWAERFNLEKLPPRKLAEVYTKVYRACIEQASYAYMTDAFLTSGEDEWLVQEIRKRWPNIAKRSDFQPIVQSLHQVRFPSFVAEETMDLLRIAQKKKKQRTEAFERHAQRYYWLENNYHRSLVLGPRYFEERLTELTHSINAKEKLEAMKAEYKKNAANKRKLLASLHASTNLKTLVELLDMLARIQDYRKQAVLRSNHFLFAAAKRVAQMHKIPRLLALFLTGPEVVEALQGTIDKQRLHQRSKGSVFIATRRGVSVYDGKKFHALHGPPFFLPRSKQSLIVGTPACPGHVSGRVKVVLRQSDFGKMKKGMILVTNNTTPEYVPIMKKARAIIADQGGLTSHTAIVSRELGIPSIIGTKLGTQLLKDGDLVEVDATQGIIKKI